MFTVRLFSCAPCWLKIFWSLWISKVWKQTIPGRYEIDFIVFDCFRMRRFGNLVKKHFFKLHSEGLVNPGWDLRLKFKPKDSIRRASLGVFNMVEQKVLNLASIRQRRDQTEFIQERQVSVQQFADHRKPIERRHGGILTFIFNDFRLSVGEICELKCFFLLIKIAASKGILRFVRAASALTLVPFKAVQINLKFRSRCLWMGAHSSKIFKPFCQTYLNILVSTRWTLSMNLLISF